MSFGLLCAAPAGIVVLDGGLPVPDIRAMIIDRETRLVLGASLLVLVLYFPAAFYLQRTYISPFAPAPPGTVRRIFQIEKLSMEGVGFIERATGYRRQPDLLIYEDDRPLRQIGSIGEVNKTGTGTYAQRTASGLSCRPPTIPTPAETLIATGSSGSSDLIVWRSQQDSNLQPTE